MGLSRTTKVNFSSFFITYRFKYLYHSWRDFILEWVLVLEKYLCSYHRFKGKNWQRVHRERSWCVFSPPKSIVSLQSHIRVYSRGFRGLTSHNVGHWSWCNVFSVQFWVLFTVVEIQMGALNLLGTHKHI